MTLTLLMVTLEAGMEADRLLEAGMEAGRSLEADRLLEGARGPAAGAQASGRWLVAFKGFPGSGKSTLARAVGRRLDWALIDKDDIKDVLDGATPAAGALAYTVMFNVARRQLLQGLSVLCDSPLTHATGYARAAALAAETGASLAVVECRCPDPDAWRARVEARQGRGLPAHHQTDWASLQDHLRTARVAAAYPIAHPYLVVDTDAPVPALCAWVVGWLARQQTPAGAG